MSDGITLAYRRPPQFAQSQPATIEPPIEGFTIKDSGKRQEFASGMVRDVETGKTQWHRIYDGPMIERYAIHLTKGAAKYPDVDGKANWMKAAGEAEYLRAKRSAARHFAQWFRGETDEDHAAAVIFNMNLAEYVKENANV